MLLLKRSSKETLMPRSSCTPQGVGFSDVGPATRVLPQLTKLTFGHGYGSRVNLEALRGGHMGAASTALWWLRRCTGCSKQDTLCAVPGPSLRQLWPGVPTAKLWCRFFRFCCAQARNTFLHPHRIVAQACPCACNHACLQVPRS